MASFKRETKDNHKLELCRVHIYPAPFVISISGVWSIGVTDRKREICTTCGSYQEFKKKRSKQKTVFRIATYVVFLTDPLDAYISRSGDYGVNKTTDGWTKLIALTTGTQGVIIVRRRGQGANSI